MNRVDLRHLRLILAALVAGFTAAVSGAQALAPEIVVTRVINAPAEVPAIRMLRTLVDLDFKSLPDNRTELTLRNFGYGTGPELAKNKAYFDQAWPAVMGSLEKRLAAKG